MTDINKDQIAYWNGDMALRWLRVEDQLDQFLENPLAELLRIADVKAGERVLDVGCGAGVATLAVARLVGPAGTVVGVDVSQSMLDQAKRHLAASDLDNVSFVEADAQVHSFERVPFDLVTSRFGVMFFDDPVAAFRNLTSVLKPEGRVAVMGWAAADDNNPWFAVPRDIAVGKVGPPLVPADPHAPSPFAFADVDRVIGLLEAAGLADVKGELLELRLEFRGTADVAAEIMLSVGPAARLLREHEAGPEVVRAVQLELAGELALYADDGRLNVPATVTVFTARRG